MKFCGLCRFHRLRRSRSEPSGQKATPATPPPACQRRPGLIPKGFPDRDPSVRWSSCYRFAVVNQSKPQCCSRFRQQQHRIIGLCTGPAKSCNFDSSAKFARRFVDQVVLKHDEAVKQPVTPGHFAGSLDVHQGRELITAELHQAVVEPYGKNHRRSVQVGYVCGPASYL